MGKSGCEELKGNKDAGERREGAGNIFDLEIPAKIIYIFAAASQADNLLDALAHFFLADIQSS